MKLSRQMLLVFAIGSLLVGCGQKGLLYREQAMTEPASVAQPDPQNTDKPDDQAD